MTPVLDGSLTVSSASALLRGGEVSARDLLEHVIRRIEQTEPGLHAYASADFERARQDAAAADRTPARSPLHGIPFGVKDVFDVAGVTSACGSRVLDGNVPFEDAAVVKSLRGAGAVLVGKHVTHELTCGVDRPPTRNPHSPAHYPGGSSVGSAVSVAAGSALFALGTDAAGSVRIPASVNGIVGLKPTHGLISAAGVARAATAPSIDHVGILARTVGDVALVLSALAPRPAGHAGTGLRGLRIGLLEDDFSETDPEVLRLVSGAVAELTARGARLVKVDLPQLRHAPEVTAAFFGKELAKGNRHLFSQRQGDYHPAVRQIIASGLAMRDTGMDAARARRKRVRVELLTTFVSERLDALVTPTMLHPPPALADFDPAADLAGLTARTCPFNLTGQPAISVPCGRTAGGLPVGLQIAGNHYGEATVLRIASACSAPPVVPTNASWS